MAGRIVRHPAPTLVAGLVFFGALAFGVLGYAAAGFGGNTSPPAGSDSAAGTALLAQHFPQSSANPTNVIFRFDTPVWQNPAAAGQPPPASSRPAALFTQVTGPLNPGGAPLTPAQFTALHAALGPAKALPPVPPAGTSVSPAAYQAYRATATFVSPDGTTVQYATGLKAGDPSTTSAMNAVPSIRAETTAVAKSIGAADSGVAGEAPALYDISTISNSDLARVIPIAIVAIGILLALVMRSLVAPLYLIASVALSYFAALGLAVLLFIGIGGESGLTFFLPFLMFIFLLALGEDYNILVMTRIREEARQRPLRDAVTRAISRHWHHRDLRRAGARGYLHRAHSGRGPRIGRQPGPRHRPRPRARHPDGHVPRAHPARALHGGAARPVELVAVPDEQDRPPDPARPVTGEARPGHRQRTGAQT